MTAIAPLDQNRPDRCLEKIFAGTIFFFPPGRDILRPQGSMQEAPDQPQDDGEPMALSECSSMLCDADHGGGDIRCPLFGDPVRKPARGAQTSQQMGTGIDFKVGVGRNQRRCPRLSL